MTHVDRDIDPGSSKLRRLAIHRLEHRRKALLEVGALSAGPKADSGQ
jgi:hypothetical protein